MAKCMIMRRGGGGGGGGLPSFTYTGTYTLIDDGDKNWRIKFLTSGTLVFTKNPGTMDLFLLGAGGSGANSTNNGAGSGGGSGYTYTSVVTVEQNTQYAIVIGAGSVNSDGGATTAMGKTALGGKKGTSYLYGGDGGSGGARGDNGFSLGGVDGADGGGRVAGLDGTGQHTTTREFGEVAGTLYATGGNATGSPVAKLDNTGDGGDGTSNYNAPGAGGSGIVVIRNHREAAA